MKKLYFWMNVILRSIFEFIVASIILGLIFGFFMFIGGIIICQLAGFWFMLPWYFALPACASEIFIVGFLLSCLGMVGIPGMELVSGLFEGEEKDKEYLRMHR